MAWHGCHSMPSSRQVPAGGVRFGRRWPPPARAFRSPARCARCGHRHSAHCLSARSASWGPQQRATSRHAGCAARTSTNAPPACCHPGRERPMSYLKSLPADAALLQVLQAYPRTAKPLLELHEVVMRGSSPFTAAERELMAAYVSGLNECTYCHGVHAATAEAFGMPAELLTAAIVDLDTAP